MPLIQRLLRPVVTLRTPAPREENKDVDPTTAARLARNRVLVLDGDQQRQWLLADAVLRAGGDAAVARFGAEALEVLGGPESELHALLVGGLSDGSRRGFVAWARPRFPGLAIVALADDPGEATELYNAGADIVTTPPLDVDLVGAKLGAAIRRLAPPQDHGGER